VIRLLRAALFLEFGFMLLVVPWSAYWDRNYFAALVPHLHALIINNFIRGAVSGLGLINVVAGVAELVTVYNGRPAASGVSITSSQQATEE
jgi:hypothetical protein